MMRSSAFTVYLGTALAASAGLASPAGATLQVGAEREGCLKISNSKENAAVVTAEEMRPGDSATGTVRLGNLGKVTSAFSVSASNFTETPGSEGGRLSEVLEAKIEELDGEARKSLYSGRLATMATVPLGRFASGESRAYRLTVRFPDGGLPPSPTGGDNRYQGASASVDYVWTMAEEGSGDGGLLASAEGGSGCGADAGGGQGSSGGGGPDSGGTDGSLPYTGLPLALLAALGLALLVSGTVLRRRSDA